MAEARDQLTGKIENLRIGILKEGFGLKNSEADVDKMVREAAEQLATVGGAVVEEVSIPIHSHGGRIFRAILEIGGDRMMFDGAGFGTSVEMYYDTTLQEAFFDAALEKYDVLILPTIPKKAPVFPKEKSPPLQDYLERASESVPNTSPTNVTGHPALSINAGFSDGLPVGMMIVGRKLDEATILNVARAYEKIRDTTFEPF